MIKVFAFYPNLGIPIRITEYRSKRAAYDYISGLRMCDTPYCAFQNDKVIDYDGGDTHMTKTEMAIAIMEEARRIENKRIPYANSGRQQDNDLQSHI